MQTYDITFGDAAMTVNKAVLRGVEKGTTGGDLPFEGLLSSTRRDRQDEAFTAKALEAMAGQINGSPLDLVADTHKPGVADTLGYLTKAWVGEGQDGAQELYIQGYLFGTDATARRVYKQMGDGRVTLSVGGKLPSPRAAYKAFEDGRPVRYINEIIADHALACRKGTAVNPDTWTAPIAKAIADAEAEEDTTQETKMVDTDAAVEAVEAETVEEQTVLEVDLVDVLLDQIAKAGKRNSTADMQRLHSAIAVLRETCGCEDCAGPVEKAQPEKETDMPNETVVEKAEEVSEAPAEETVVEEPVEKAATEETQVAEEEAQVETVEETVETAPAEEPVEDVEKAQMAERIATLEAELEVLKVAPAGGGPQGKPSGDVEKVTGPAPELDVAKAKAEAAAAHDARGYAKLLAAQMLTGQ